MFLNSFYVLFFSGKRTRLIDTYALVPKPNGPQNVLHFRHGHMPLEGRVWPDLVKQMDDFLLSYNPEVALRTRNVTECVPGEPPKKHQVCFFDIRAIDEACTRGDYGYATGQPCIFIQFNNISGWRPEPFTPEEILAKNDSSFPQTEIALNKNMIHLECKGKYASTELNSKQILANLSSDEIVFNIKQGSARGGV